MIKVSHAGGLLRLTLSRPEKANALTASMLESLIDAIADHGADSRVLVLTGQGSVFSAGADLQETRTGLATSELWDTLSGAIANLPALSVAALNGTLAGGAFGMALACDLRICTARSNFFYPVMKRGLLPQPSDPARLAELIGPARAKMILMAGQKIDAATALDWGLVDRVADDGALETELQNLVADALAADPDHVAAIKALFARPATAP